MAAHPAWCACRETALRGGFFVRKKERPPKKKLRPSSVCSGRGFRTWYLAGAIFWRRKGPFFGTFDSFLEHATIAGESVQGVPFDFQVCMVRQAWQKMQSEKRCMYCLMGEESHVAGAGMPGALSGEGVDFLPFFVLKKEKSG